MKNKIKDTFNKILTAARLTNVFSAVAVVAVENANLQINNEPAANQFSGQDGVDTNSLFATKKSNFKTSEPQMTGKDYFQIGKDFSIALFDAEQISKNEDALNYLIADLVYLIEKLEGELETVKLQKILKAVVRKTSNPEQIHRDIETESKIYLKRQSKDNKWYLKAGAALMNLTTITYTSGETKIKKILSELQSLVKIAPKGMSEEITNQMNKLANYIVKTSFTEKDYATIYNSGQKLMTTVLA